MGLILECSPRVMQYDLQMVFVNGKWGLMGWFIIGFTSLLNTVFTAVAAFGFLPCPNLQGSQFIDN